MIHKIIVEGQPIPAKRVTRYTLWTAREYSEYKEYLGWKIREILKIKKPKKEDVMIKKISFHRKGKRRADIDNLLKCVMEALALSGYVENDKQIIGIKNMAMFHDQPKPFVEIWI